MHRAVAQYELRPVIDSTFPLEKGSAAFERLRSGQHFGKIVLAV